MQNLDEGVGGGVQKPQEGQPLGGDWGHSRAEGLAGVGANLERQS